MVVRDDWDVSVAEYREEEDLSPLATDAPGQLDVLGHDGDPLGVNGAQVGVLKQTNEVGLAGLLEPEETNLYTIPNTLNRSHDNDSQSRGLEDLNLLPF